MVHVVSISAMRGASWLTCRSETHCKHRHFVTNPIGKCTCPSSLHLLMRLWLYDGLVARIRIKEDVGRWRVGCWAGVPGAMSVYSHAFPRSVCCRFVMHCWVLARLVKQHNVWLLDRHVSGQNHALGSFAIRRAALAGTQCTPSLRSRIPQSPFRESTVPPRPDQLVLCCRSRLWVDD